MSVILPKLYACAVSCDDDVQVQRELYDLDGSISSTEHWACAYKEVHSTNGGQVEQVRKSVHQKTLEQLALHALKPNLDIDATLLKMLPNDIGESLHGNYRDLVHYFESGPSLHLECAKLNEKLIKNSALVNDEVLKELAGTDFPGADELRDAQSSKAKHLQKAVGKVWAIGRWRGAVEEINSRRSSTNSSASGEHPMKRQRSFKDEKENQRAPPKLCNADNICSDSEHEGQHTKSKSASSSCNVGPRPDVHCSGSPYGDVEGDDEGDCLNDRHAASSANLASVNDRLPFLNSRRALQCMPPDIQNPHGPSPLTRLRSQRRCTTGELNSEKMSPAKRPIHSPLKSQIGNRGFSSETSTKDQATGPSSVSSSDIREPVSPSSGKPKTPKSRRLHRMESRMQDGSGP